jgi:hypothetical protein
MVSGLRSRLALIGLLGAFLIPIGVSSLRGLTHVLTCQQSTDVPFTVSLPAGAEPTISSATSFTRGEEKSLCGGLHLDMRVGREDLDTLRIALPIQNGTTHDWQGTVKVNLAGTAVPIRIGKVPAGATREQTIHVNIDRGAHEITGSLLIGP